LCFVSHAVQNLKCYLKLAKSSMICFFLGGGGHVIRCCPGTTADSDRFDNNLIVIYVYDTQRQVQHALAGWLIIILLCITDLRPIFLEDVEKHLKRKYRSEKSSGRRSNIVALNRLKRYLVRLLLLRFK